MTLLLDARQRAMLAEMGIRVFLPDPAPAEEAEDVPVVLAPPLAAALPAVAPRVPAAPVQARTPPPQPAPVARPAGAAPAMLEPTLLGAGDPRPDWLLLLDPPNEEEQRLGRPMLGDAGRLLDNMLAALGILRRQGVYLACVPAGGDAAAVAGLVRQEVERLRPKIILALGRFAVQGLLQTGEPPGRLRGRPHDFHGVPVVVSYHPASLLRNPAEKGKAWVDLCLAASLLKARA